MGKPYSEDLRRSVGASATHISPEMVNLIVKRL
jgi:hypothetical protein